MRVTLSVIKADVGSVGGHTRPSERMLAAVREEVRGAIDAGLLLDGLVTRTGDDIAIVARHTHGRGTRPVHDLAWRAFMRATRAFMRATEVAKKRGLHGAGRDLPTDAPAGDPRGRDRPCCPTPRSSIRASARRWAGSRSASARAREATADNVRTAR